MGAVGWDEYKNPLLFLPFCTPHIRTALHHFFFCYTTTFASPCFAFGIMMFTMEYIPVLEVHHGLFLLPLLIQLPIQASSISKEQ
jgi:hypothetical protein